MSRGGRESRGSREIDSRLIANEIVYHLQLHEIVSRPPGDERKQEESDSTVNAFTIRLLLLLLCSSIFFSTESLPISCSLYALLKFGD